MEDLLPRPEPQRPLGERIRAHIGDGRPAAWIRWFGVGRLVTIAVSVVLVVAGATWLLAPPRPPVEASLPMAAGAATSAAPETASGPVGTDPGGATDRPAASGTGGTDTAGGTGGTTDAADPGPPVDIVVHVAGAVVAPGIHRVPASARVADAVAAAGGPSVDAHTDAINLAAPLRDGDRVFVPRIDEGLLVPAGVTAGSAAVPGVAGEPAGPVSINTATVEQLDGLPGVGPATAAAIVAHRDANGPFASIDALGDVRGIGPAKLEAIRPLVVL